MFMTKTAETPTFVANIREYPTQGHSPLSPIPRVRLHAPLLNYLSLTGEIKDKTSCMTNNSVAVRRKESVLVPL